MQIVKYLLWFPITFVLLGVFAPLLGALLLAILGISLFIILLTWIPGFNGDGEYGRLESTRDILTTTTYILPMVIIMRAEIVLIYPNVPSAMEIMNKLYQPLVDVFGYQVIPITDLSLAASSAFVLLLFTLQDQFWRLGQVRNLETMPFAKARSAFVGLVKMQGIARPLPKAKNQETILSFSITMSDKSRVSESVTFLLEDDTGSILVNTRNARISSDLGDNAENTGYGEYSDIFDGTAGNRVREILLPKHARTTSSGQLEFSLRAGDPITLMGVARPIGKKNAKKTGLAESTLIVAPQKGSFGDRFHDVFILSSGEDQPLRHYFLNGMVFSWLFAFFCFLLFAGMARVAWQGIGNFENAYGYQHAQQIQVEKDQARPIIPILDRTIETPQTPGKVSVEQLLGYLHTAPAGNVLHYLGYLDRLGARELAAIELRKIIRENSIGPRTMVATSTLNNWGYPLPSKQKSKTKPLLERQIKLPISGQILTIGQVLQKLRASSAKNTLSYIYLLDKHGARAQTETELKWIVANSNDPEKVKIARQFLSQWKRD